MKKKFLTIVSTFIAFAMMTLVAPAANAASATLPKFIAHRDYLFGNGAIGLALGDLNGDGIADLVAPNSNTNNVGVLLWKSEWQLPIGTVVQFRRTRPLDAVVADFNGDGKNDVAVTIPFWAFPSCWVMVRDTSSSRRVALESSNGCAVS
jgi:hypothetical protein